MAIEYAIGLLTKRERRKHRVGAWRVVQVSKTSMPTTWLTVHILQLLPATQKKEDIELKEIIRGMEDLQIKLARLEKNTSITSSKVTFK